MGKGLSWIGRSGGLIFKDEEEPPFGRENEVQMSMMSIGKHTEKA